MSGARYEGLDLFRGLSVFSIVLVHVHKLTGGANSDLVLRVRDFAFPVLFMSSFFVMAVSCDRKPGRPYAELVRARVVRLLVPSLIWSYLYWAGWWFVRPVLLGAPMVPPPLSLAITAFMHLWFLHMVFVMTVALSPVLLGVARGVLPRWPTAIACAAGVLACVWWLEPALLSLAASMPHSTVPFGAPTIADTMGNAAPYLAYIPAGLALGLARGAIDDWHRHQLFRHGTVVVALLALVLHVSTRGVPFSRELFSIAVFVAVLRPLPPRPYVWIRGLAQWSYGVYILHFAFVMAFVMAFERSGLDRTAVTSIAGTLIVFALSLAAAMVLRRSLPFDWLLPMVPVSKGPRRTDSGG